MGNNKFYLDNYLEQSTKFGYNGKIYEIKSREDIKNILLELSKENSNIVTEFCNAYNLYVLNKESEKGEEHFIKYLESKNMTKEDIRNMMKETKDLEVGKEFFMTQEEKDAEKIEKFLNEKFPEEQIENLEVHKKATEEKNKKNKKGIIKKIVAIAVAGTLLVTSIAACNKIKRDLESTPTNINIDGMDFDQLFNLLTPGIQQNSFKVMDEVQNDFNNKKAPKIKIDADKNAQLYLTAEEIIQLFTKANAITSTDSFKDIFGNSGLMNKEKLESNYEETISVLVAYYLRATEKSGMSKLFQDKGNRELVEEVENLYLNYKKNPTSKNKTAISNKIDEIYFSGKIDNLKEQYPEAAHYIASTMVPAMQQQYIISTSLANKVADINGDEMCTELDIHINEIVKQCESLETVTVKGQNINKNDEVLKAMPEAMNKKNIKVEKRDIDLTSTVKIKTPANVNLNKKAGTKKIEDFEAKRIKKKDAIEEFGKDAVEKAEKEADATEELVDIDNKYYTVDEANKIQEEIVYKGHQEGRSFRDQIYKDMYAGSYNYYYYSNKIDQIINSYNGKYKTLYIKSLREGFQDAVKSAQDAYNQEAELRAQKAAEVTYETPTVERVGEKVTTNNQNNNNNEEIKVDETYQTPSTDGYVYEEIVERVYTK